MECGHFVFMILKNNFYSEIKGILKHKIKSEINLDALNLYFSLGFIPAPYSIYKNINKLEQRQSLIYNLKTNVLEKEYYYDWPNFNPQKKNFKKEFCNLIKDATKLRMVSDVPLGAFLSGGLDSSTIVNFAQMFNKNINTYSIGFEGKYDETPYINITKNHFKTNHHHKYYTEKDFKNQLKEIFYYFDEPFSDSSMFPTEFLTKFAREELTVSLSGDGGDEVFGGYPRYKYALQLTILRKIPKLIRKLLMFMPSSKLKEGLKLSLLSKESFYSEARTDFYKPQITREILEKRLKKCLEKTNNDLIQAVRLMDIEFYTSKIFPTNSLVHNNYKIRLYLFYRWYKYWNKN